MPKSIVLTAVSLLVTIVNPTDVRGQASDATVARRITAAVAPLPNEMRDGATVLAHAEGGRMTTLRQGTNVMVCLTDDPAPERFHVACYHRSLEPFMARGRALRASGVTGDAVDSARFAEVRSGKLEMPAQPASLYSLTGPPGSFDAATNAVKGARALHVVYIPNATAESTGLSAVPSRDGPWIMFPGTPKAHIMFTMTMR